MARIIIKTAQRPYKIMTVEGEKKICMCGLSKNQPFCDESHHKTDDENPDLLYQYDETGKRSALEEDDEDCCCSDKCCSDEKCCEDEKCECDDAECKDGCGESCCVDEKEEEFCCCGGHCCEDKTEVAEKTEKTEKTEPHHHDHGHGHSH